MGLCTPLSEAKWRLTPTESYGTLGWLKHFIRLLAIAVSLLSWIQFIIDGERSKSELRCAFPPPPPALAFPFFLFNSTSPPLRLLPSSPLKIVLKGRIL